MKFGVFGVVDVGPLDPAVWAALAICGVLAWFAGKGIGRLAPRLQHSRFRSLAIASACVLLGVALTILTHVVFEALYRAAHDLGDSWIVSAAFAWPLLLIPAILLFVSTHRAVRREARQQAA